MTDIGLNQCEARTSTPRIAKKRAIYIQPDHAKSLASNLSRILTYSASKIEQICFTRHTLEKIG